MREGTYRVYSKGGAAVARGSQRVPKPSATGTALMHMLLMRARVQGIVQAVAKEGKGH